MDRLDPGNPEAQVAGRRGAGCTGERREAAHRKMRGTEAGATDASRPKP
jgi:hypothetical protein